MVSPGRFWPLGTTSKVTDSKAVRATARFRRFSKSEAAAVAYVGSAGLIQAALGMDLVDAARLAPASVFVRFPLPRDLAATTADDPL